MKFYPSTDPRSRHFPKKARDAERAEATGRQIAKLRQAAQWEMNRHKSRLLSAAADELAQGKLSLKIPPRAGQLNLFTGELEPPTPVEPADE